MSFRSRVSAMTPPFYVKTLDIKLLYRVSFHVEGYDIEGEVRKGELEPTDGERSPPRALRRGAGSAPCRRASPARGSPPTPVAPPAPDGLNLSRGARGPSGRADPS